MSVPSSRVAQEDREEEKEEKEEEEEYLDEEEREEEGEVGFQEALYGFRFKFGGKVANENA